MTCDSMTNNSQHDAEVVPSPAEPSMRWPLIRASSSKPLLQALTLLPNGAAAAAAAIALQAGFCRFQCSFWRAAEQYCAIVLVQLPSTLDS